VTGIPKKNVRDPDALVAGQVWRCIDKRRPREIKIDRIDMRDSPPTVEYLSWQNNCWRSIRVRLDEFVKLYEFVPEKSPPVPEKKL